MALKLTIPALTDKPLIPAETRTNKISEFLENTAKLHALEAATAVFEELENLNRQKMAADARIKVLELYRPTLMELTARLAEVFKRAPLPLPKENKAHVSIAESLWLEMGYGYKLALLDEQGRLFSLGSSKSNALIVQRAIDALRRLAMIHYQTYFQPPANLWGDMNQLYLYAAQESLHEVQVPDEGGVSSPNDVFKRALLMELANPQRLSPIDIQRVADYIARYGHLVQLQDLGILDNPAAIFLVRLNSQTPPIPYIKNSEALVAGSDILLITVDLARLVHKQIQALQSGDNTSDDLPQDVRDPRYQDLLSYLLKQWGMAPKRMFNRSRKNNSVSLGFSLTSAHYFLNGNRPYAGVKEDEPQQITAELASSTSNNQTPEIFDPSRWVVLNISAGGMALRKPSRLSGNIRVGDILCIKEDNVQNWSIGVIRWAVNDEQEHLDIGIQLIAPTAVAIGLRRPGQQQFERGLELPNIQTLKQPASLVAPKGTYSPAKILELEDRGEVFRIMATKLVERTDCFERFNYSRLT